VTCGDIVAPCPDADAPPAPEAVAATHAADASSMTTDTLAPCMTILSVGEPAMEARSIAGAGLRATLATQRRRFNPGRRP
jgi:hypothetical protein